MRLAAAGSIAIGNLVLSGYDIGLVAFAAVLAAFASWALKRTRYGRLLTVVIFDRETAAAFGVNVKLVYTVTFLLGAVLGAIGGAVMAPKIAVTLGIGVEASCWRLRWLPPAACCAGPARCISCRSSSSS